MSADARVAPGSKLVYRRNRPGVLLRYGLLRGVFASAQKSNKQSRKITLPNKWATRMAQTESTEEKPYLVAELATHKHDQDEHEQEHEELHE